VKCARSDAKTRDHPCNFEQRTQLAFCQVREINAENEVSMECKFSSLFLYPMEKEYGSQITMDGVNFEKN